MTRSWWGWGTVEDAASDQETQALIARAAQAMPTHDFADHRPPDPKRLGLPAPRITAPNPLSALCSADPEDRAGHARGKAFRDVVRNLQGRLDHVPDLVTRPRTERDVIDLLDWCSRDAIAVIPYGGGSSVVGGIEPRFDGPAVTMDLTAMDAVLEIDRAQPRRPYPGRGARPTFGGPASPAWCDAAAFSAVFRFLHTRRLAGHTCRRSLRHALHPHRRSHRVPAGRHTRRRQCSPDGCRDPVRDRHRIDCSWDRREPSE